MSIAHFQTFNGFGPPESMVGKVSFIEVSDYSDEPLLKGDTGITGDPDMSILVKEGKQIDQESQNRSCSSDKEEAPEAV